MQTQQQNFANAIVNALSNKQSINALLTTNTVVTVAAKHKNSATITKVTTANVTLYACANAYLQLVQASAAQIQANANNANNVVNFAVSASKYTHLNNAHCIAMLNSNLYLQCIVNSANSVYFINNVVATKQQVAQYLTASASAALLNNSNITHNKTNNVTHNVIVRTYKFASIQSLQLLNACASANVINNASFTLA